jgi:predicted Zn-dependent peptidase
VTGVPTLAAALLSTFLCALVPTTGTAQVEPGRAAVDRLTFEPLVFEQPEVEHHEIGGVRVLLLEDRDLPLVTVYAYIRGGYGLFDRRHFAPALGLPAMLRYGGTETRTPADVDETLERYAFQLSFGTAGGSVTSSINTLTEHLPLALELWGDMLARPRFDGAEIEAWRARQLESVLRRVDDPARLAYSEINRLLFGDHPIGWEMDADDLEPERLAPRAFRFLHDRIVCRDNAILGVTGDASWNEVEGLLTALVERLPVCAEPLPEAPTPEIRRAPGVFLVEKELDQSVVVMAHPTDVRLADEGAYYAAMTGNSILGGGGFSSRLLGRVRTEEGFAYSATSLWTTPRRHEGIIGATTRTRPENTVPAIELILDIMAELREAPPTAEEVGTTVDRIVNGFVFNFDTPGQIVSRTMYYLAQELPEDWLERYWAGVQEVTPEDVRAVFAEHLRPDDMTILVVGDPARITTDLRRLGPVTVVDPARTRSR